MEEEEEGGGGGGWNRMDEENGGGGELRRGWSRAGQFGGGPQPYMWTCPIFGSNLGLHIEFKSTYRVQLYL